jgi:hypothetical protein|tara:strand:+ start:1436 stop:1777 length:342 start_codon:yes stop_codon:yes gene_type:complete
MTIQMDNKGNHFFIEIVPNIDDTGKWLGEFQLVINARKTNIDDDSFYQLEQLCQMGCAALSLMEEDKDIQNKVYDYMESPETITNKSVPKNTALIHEVSDNVISVKFDKGIKS